MQNILQCISVKMMINRLGVQSRSFNQLNYTLILRLWIASIQIYQNFFFFYHYLKQYNLRRFINWSWSAVNKRNVLSFEFIYDFYYYYYYLPTYMFRDTSFHLKYFSNLLDDSVMNNRYLLTKLVVRWWNKKTLIWIMSLC